MGSLLKQMVFAAPGLFIAVAPVLAGSALVREAVDGSGSLRPDALQALRTELKKGDAAALAIKAELMDLIWRSADPQTIRIGSSLVAVHADEPSAGLLFNKAFTPAATSVQIAAMEGLREVLAKKPALSQTTIETIVPHLQQTAVTKSLSAAHRNAALMALAAVGESAFEAVAKVHDASRRSASGLIYTALGTTGDVRALPLLRAAIEDEGVQPGLRVQAISAIGRVFVALRKKAYAVGVEEQQRCVEQLMKLISAEPEIAAVTLTTLAEIPLAAGSSQFVQVVEAGLGSREPRVREAALQVIFQQPSLRTRAASTTIHQLAETDPDELARSTAKAIVEQVLAESPVDTN